MRSWTQVMGERSRDAGRGLTRGFSGRIWPHLTQGREKVQGRGLGAWALREVQGRGERPELKAGATPGILWMLFTN